MERRKFKAAVVGSSSRAQAMKKNHTLAMARESQRSLHKRFSEATEFRIRNACHRNNLFESVKANAVVTAIQLYEYLPFSKRTNTAILNRWYKISLLSTTLRKEKLRCVVRLRYPSFLNGVEDTVNISQSTANFSTWPLRAHFQSSPA